MNINLTIIGQSISFAIFVWFCLKFIWPPIINALRERQRQIAKGLEQAEQAGQNMEIAARKAEEIVAEAKHDAQAIIEQAGGRAEQIIEQAKRQAVVEGEQLKEAAQADIEQTVSRARDGLRAELSELVISGTEKVLQSAVERSHHEAALKQLAAEL